MRAPLLATALALLPGLALAEGTCDFGAYASGPAPVHAGPSADSALLGTLAMGAPGTDDEGFGAEFLVKEMQTGWARISNVSSPDGIGPGGPEGWINGADVSFVAQTEVAFTAPDANAEMAYAGGDWPFAKTLLDCSGPWAQIEFPLYFHKTGETEPLIQGFVTAWVRGICSNQRTTCDGTWGDRMPE